MSTTRQHEVERVVFDVFGGRLAEEEPDLRAGLMDTVDGDREVSYLIEALNALDSAQSQEHRTDRSGEIRREYDHVRELLSDYLRDCLLDELDHICEHYAERDLDPERVRERYENPDGSLREGERR